MKIKFQIPGVVHEPKRQLCMKGVKESNAQWIQDTALIEGYASAGDLFNVIVESLREQHERGNKVRTKGRQVS